MYLIVTLVHVAFSSVDCCVLHELSLIVQCVLNLVVFFVTEKIYTRQKLPYRLKTRQCVVLVCDFIRDNAT